MTALATTRALETEVADYLRFKQKRLTAKSMRGYKAALAELADFFPDHDLERFEPPAGTALIEEFLSVTWGARSARTYNKNYSIVHNFFEWQVRRGAMRGDPTLPIEKAKARKFHRTIFADEQRQAIFAANTDIRDSLALRLLLDYGIRKGALQNVQLMHFDHQRRQLTIFTKGEKILHVLIPDPAFWADLETLDTTAAPHEYLIPRERVTRRQIPARAQRLTERIDDSIVAAARLTEDLTQLLDDEESSSLGAALIGAVHALAQVQKPRERRRRWVEEQIGEHGLHDWWYRALRRAGIVPDGVRSGQRMHKARHSAGQRVLDATGNIKAVQKMLGHASAQTTLDEYIDWDDTQLADTLYQVIVEKRDGTARNGARA